MLTEGTKVKIIYCPNGYFGATGVILCNAAELIPLDVAEQVYIIRLDDPISNDDEFMYYSAAELEIVERV